MSTLFLAAPARPRTWFGRIANGLGLTCLLLSIVTAVFFNASRTLCMYAGILVLLTTPLALLTVLLGFRAREKFAWRSAGAGLLVVILVAASYGLHPCGGRAFANEVQAVDSLREIVTAQQEFAGKNPQTGYAATLGELGPSGANLIDGALAQGAKSGYRFILEPGPPDAQGRIGDYALHAVPVLYGSTGARSFLSNPSGAIWQTSEYRRATPADPPVN